MTCQCSCHRTQSPIAQACCTRLQNTVRCAEHWTNHHSLNAPCRVEHQGHDDRVYNDAERMAHFFDPVLDGIVELTRCAAAPYGQRRWFTSGVGVQGAWAYLAWKCVVQMGRRAEGYTGLGRHADWAVQRPLCYGMHGRSHV